MDNAEMTVAEFRIAIDSIFAERRKAAAQSQYDRSVCLGAVAAAREIYDQVPVAGSAAEFGQAVIYALAPFHKNYNDRDGEYTSGKGVIGDVILDIRHLVDHLAIGGSQGSDNE